MHGPLPKRTKNIYIINKENKCIYLINTRIVDICGLIFISRIIKEI